MVGKLEVVTGCMFAGKTSKLVRMVRQARTRGRGYACFVPSTDTRSDGWLRTHDGAVEKATVSDTDGLEILRTVATMGQVGVVFVDEAQFFGEELVRKVCTLNELGIDVVVAGLKSTWNHRPFGPMPTLLALADNIIFLRATCAVSGRLATRTQRLGSSTDEVLIGGAESYEARNYAYHEYGSIAVEKKGTEL